MHRALTRTDILPLDSYAELRLEKRQKLVALKKHRQLFVGPHVTVTFECWESMWYQVQEMLFIEKGGDAQLEEELAAYAPMVPNGHELVATLMFEIEDEALRTRLLSALGGVEDSVSLLFADQRIAAQPESDVGRSTAEGKTSAVHFLHFPLSSAQSALFKQEGMAVVFAIRHPDYQHMAVLPESVRATIALDLD